MNKVILMGRLTRNPEILFSRGEPATKIAKFSLAVDRRFKRQGEQETDFFNCTAFGKQADFVENYLKQGTKMLITGRIQNDNYTNREGQKVYSVQVMVDELEFAESKNANTNVGMASEANHTYQQPVTRQNPNPPIGENFINQPNSSDLIDDEFLFMEDDKNSEIPFKD